MLAALLAMSAAFAQAGPDIVLTDEDRAPIWAPKLTNKVSLGGYFETDYLDDFAGNNSFDQHRMVLFVSADVHSRITFATEIEWEHGGSPRKSDGELVVGEVLLEYAIADFRIADWLQWRNGIVLVPVGAYNLYHDAPGQDLATRPLVSTFIAPSTWFETGSGAYGTIPLGQQTLSYEAYFINGLDSKLYDGLGARAARGSLAEDNNSNKALVARLAWAPLNGLTIGLSGYRGAYDPASERFVRMGAVDWMARWRTLELQGEAVLTDIDAGFDEGWGQATRGPVPEAMSGFYGQLNWHFMPTPLLMALPGELNQATFTAVARYGEIDTDRAQVSAGDRSRLMLGLNFRPVEAFVFKNELLLDTTGADGQLARPFTSNWTPSYGYVGSVAVMF